MTPERLLLEVFWPHPTRKRPHARPIIHRRHFMSHLAWSSEQYDSANIRDIVAPSLFSWRKWRYIIFCQCLRPRNRRLFMREHQGRLSINIFIGALKMFYEDRNVSNTNLKDVCGKKKTNIKIICLFTGKSQCAALTLKLCMKVRSNLSMFDRPWGPKIQFWNS